MATTKEENGTDDVRRRIRFDADADLRLLQAVCRREPFAADHGMKLKAWDDVADEVYATAAKLRDVPSSRRAVTDRFHHLVQRHEQGELKLKRWADTPGGEEKAALVQSLLRQISGRLAERKSVKVKKPSSAESSPASRKRDASFIEPSGTSTMAEGDPIVLMVDPKAGAYDRAHASRRKVQLDSVLSARTTNDAAYNEILALKREKLALKRQKLELLHQQHEDRMILERRRLELEEKRFNSNK